MSKQKKHPAAKASRAKKAGAKLAKKPVVAKPAAADEGPLKPVKATAEPDLEQEHDVKGPVGWLLPDRESTYASLVPRGAAERSPPAGLPEAGVAFASPLRPGGGEEVLDAVPAEV